MIETLGSNDPWPQKNSSESRSDIFNLRHPEGGAPLGADLGVESVVTILDQNLNYIDGDVYGTDLVRRLRGEFAWRGAILIQSANCETSDVREYLHAGADGALDKGVSAALQTDVLARVYHDRFPDRPAGAAPKRARRE